MRMIQTCPKGGCDLYDIIKTSYPPKSAKTCINCGWEYTYDNNSGDAVRVPFTVPVTTVSVTNDPCRNCSNDPRNGGSGVCCCAVPYLSPNSPYKITC